MTAPTYHELLRYAALQPCVYADYWSKIGDAISDASDCPDTAQAWRELREQEAACECIPCRSRRAPSEEESLGIVGDAPTGK
jgi:hypothetical protein